MSEPAKIHSLEDIHNALAPKNERPLFVYKVPAGIAANTGVSSVGLVELSPNEMILVQRRGGDDKAAIMFEMVKESWRMMNGAPITTGDGSADAAWSREGVGWTKLRTLLTSAMNKIHNPTKDDNDAFLASESVQVGR